MRKYLIGLLVGIVIMLGVGYPIISNQESKIQDLSMDIGLFEQDVVAETMHNVLTEPGVMFMELEDHPEWEVIDAVPYSQCYRHLIGNEAMTADYIMCMAI